MSMPIINKIKIKIKSTENIANTSIVSHKKSNQCKGKNCKKRASFGKIKTKLAEFCKIHKPDDTYINVKDKT